jgi:hypothetical protein
MFLIAPGMNALANWDAAERRKKDVRGEFERLFH